MCACVCAWKNTLYGYKIILKFALVVNIVLNDPLIGTANKYASKDCCITVHCKNAFSSVKKVFQESIQFDHYNMFNLII